MASERHLPVEPIGSRQLLALGGRWDLSRGEHPSHARHLPDLLQQPHFPSVDKWQAIAQLDLPLTVCSSGHHLMRDHSYLHATTAGALADEWPLAPVFVRDLAGRVIHTGLMPLPSPSTAPVFPAGCADVTAQMQGAHLIENAIFTSLRRLEICAQPQVPLAGQPELLIQPAYPHPSQCTYKIRPDTFYQDGWRLPQVPRLFARATPSQESQKAAEDFISRWHARPPQQDYESFYEAQGAADWYETLFLSGLTIIPTMEAYNGRYHVDESYQILDVDPGRAVPGLHQVISQQDSALPSNTILQVIQPGYITVSQVVPAQVIVSNGSGFKASDAPQPNLPNLALPHTHTSSQWGAVWLPTHPQHFAEPALWDWDTSGHFQQVSGPLWDPLHYTYTSTQTILRACRKPHEDNPRIFQLPENLKSRFHPVIPQNWYDTINERTSQDRANDPTHPLFGSALDSVPLGKTVASLGYHHLPPALEYDLDPAIFPHLHPRHRVSPCPAEFSARLIQPASPVIDSQELSKHHVMMTEPMREILSQASLSALSAWQSPVLGTESGNQVTRLHLQSQLAPALLPELPASQLLINVKRLFANREYRQALQNQSPTLAAGMFRFREASLAWRRLRYRLFAKYPAIWVQAWAEALDLAVAENQFAHLLPEHHAQVFQERSKLLSVSSTTQKGVPAARAPGLRYKASTSKLPKAQTQL